MKRRSVGITYFVIIWTLMFQYESLRANYLSPLFHRPLPKLALLFPPAGWIMFYAIEPAYGFAEVYGIRDTVPVKLDPHQIFTTHAVGYENVHRNMLVGVLNPRQAPAFCRYLHWKFPAYRAFSVLYGVYPDLITSPNRVDYQVAYRCQ